MLNEAIKEEVKVTIGEIYLPGTLEIPPEARGIVLFAHGSGSSRFSPRNQFVAKVLREKGSGTLLFDLLTSDEEAEDEFSGIYRFDIGLLAKRLVGAAHWLKIQKQTRNYPIGFFGSSTGGGAALVAAAELGDKIKAVVSRGGRPDLAGESLKKVKSPTLLIVGSLDEFVLRLNEQALEALQCKKELVIIPGASHLFEEPGALNKVAAVAADWFSAHWPQSAILP
ncbi:alpha/beta hydrolase [Candidatus Methylacidiphilum fumarolicum]|uniref:Predicted phosphoribosyltransferase n=2 Tax=Candidatus Methylacidiphilum fumarolicum TaxID=591154 RepID=I0JXD8_METFB|nr:alpha/beta hydrolase [Candidatus Methylacidiphilum fumarolicum]MBW6415314.1 alpha/beta hydrolase [Candidatus Methylacidiphilum fumarolicum]TFE69299.1 hydrolase [Candidatus Methylacidiphilum fumarolicum]TFE72246.1 alpha/beta hydrolase [Candidatus Methylacidiphilum fumarolicum]TFE72388.1 alpha/beta hydrolase [Candidatus Methylacidiphilum fumarolicum]TFE77025.1 hydrolase [Candidatus Methylacidiphilum fumarolicum]